MAKTKVKEKAISVDDADGTTDVEPAMFKSLSDKDRAFCKEYILDWNGRRAYQVLYPNAGDNNAKTNASQIVTRKRIQAYCKYLSDNVEFNIGLSKSWIIEQHLKIARSSIAHLHETWITLNDFDKLTEEQKYCIEEITTQTRREIGEGVDLDDDGNPVEVEIQVDYVKLKLCDKQKSLKELAALMGYDAPIKTENKNFNINVQVSADEARKILAAIEKVI
jgi:phage terminase small subunit